jgi:crotonobetainyl-CoA:carnitine CoA-transferase CaiB-like acyl-CoA transferase
MTQPLAGIKVVDFSEHGFVPSGAAALADFGADVIKIERPQGDPMRQVIANNLVASIDGYDYMFQLVNRNKRGIALDVEAPAGREVFERLVRWADVYITNQLPRVRRKLKTEPSDLFPLNPRLVFAKGHGQGQRGGDAEAGGFDGVSYWARGSVAHLLTDPDSDHPAQQRPALGDIPTGMFLAGAVCAALVHTIRTGKGVVVDTSLLNSATWSLGPDMAYSSMTGEQLPMGGSVPRSPLTQTFTTSDGRFITLMMLDEDRYWAPACRALGLPDLVERYADPAARRSAWGQLYEEFRVAVSGIGRDDLEQRLRAQSCIYSFYATPPDVIRDDAVVQNGYLMPHPTRANLKLAAAPAQFDDELPAIRRAGPDIGEHSREILAELGYEKDDVDQLVGKGIVVAP